MAQSIKFIAAFWLSFALLALTACGGTDTASTASVEGKPSKYLNADDHVLGDPNASLVLIEYASVSCPGCAYWHNEVFPRIKDKFIDTGKVRYVFREYLASDPTLADAGFMIALCANKDNYFKNIGLQFKRQKQIFDQVKKGDARDAYIALAKASGLSEGEFISCMGQQELRDGYRARMQIGVDKGVTGTPAFFIGDKRIKSGSFEELKSALNAALQTGSE